MLTLQRKRKKLWETKNNFVTDLIGTQGIIPGKKMQALENRGKPSRKQHYLRQNTEEGAGHNRCVVNNTENSTSNLRIITEFTRI